MNRTRLIHSVILCLFLIGTTSGIAAAGERLPADDPFVQESVRAGSVAASTRLHRPLVSSGPATGGQIGGGASAQPSVATGSTDGFTAYTFEDPALTIHLPAEWEVDENSAEGHFGISIPGEFAFSFFDSFGEDAFPGLLGLTLFKNQAQALVEQIDESVELRSVVSFTTAQGYPVVRIIFGGAMEQIDVTGGFYLLSDARNVYALMMIAADRTWADIADELDIVTRNIHFQTGGGFVQAGDTPLPYTAQSSGLQLLLPAHWLVQEVEDEDIAVVVADEDLQVTGALALSPVGEIDPADLELLRELINSEDADLGDVGVQAIIDEVFGALDIQLDSDEFAFDASLNAMIPGENPTFRFGGELSFDEFSTPVLFYMNLRAEEIGLSIFLGDADLMLGLNEQLIALTNQFQSVPE